MGDTKTVSDLVPCNHCDGTGFSDRVHRPLLRETRQLYCVVCYGRGWCKPELNPPTVDEGLKGEDSPEAIVPLWQTVETAPRNGGPLLGYNSVSDEYFVMVWDVDYSATIPRTRKEEDAAKCWLFSDPYNGCNKVNPTHWMRLPPFVDEGE